MPTAVLARKSGFVIFLPTSLIMPVGAPSPLVVLKSPAMTIGFFMLYSSFRRATSCFFLALGIHRFSRCAATIVTGSSTRGICISAKRAILPPCLISLNISSPNTIPAACRLATSSSDILLFSFLYQS